MDSLNVLWQHPVCILAVYNGLDIDFSTITRRPGRSQDTETSIVQTLYATLPKKNPLHAAKMQRRL